MQTPRALPRMVVTLVTLVALVTACGPGSGPSSGGPNAVRPPIAESLAETCATQLPARAAPSTPSPAVAPPFTPARSTIVVHAEIPLAGIRQTLEAKVPRRVAEEKDHDIGAAGRLEYTVDRGPFAVRVEKDTLVVESVLQGRAQACAKGRCYAGCAPEAKLSARVALRLSADYKLHATDVRIDVTRGCEVRALGGLLTIDVTPMLRGALAQQTPQLKAAIDRELPNLAPEATRLWTELAKPHALPLGACVVLSPEEITQGPASGTAELARLDFGLLAHPEVRVKCGVTSTGAPSKLPPLRDDPTLPPAGDVHLAIVLPDDAAARGVERADVIDFGGKRARIKQATGDVATGLAMDLSGEVCGSVAMNATGAAWNDAQSLHLTGAAPLAGESDRLAAVQLDATRLVAAVEHAPIALPIAVSGLETLLPELARGMSDDKVTVSATVESAKPETAGLRAADVIAVALLRGAVTIRAK